MNTAELPDDVFLWARVAVQRWLVRLLLNEAAEHLVSAQLHEEAADELRQAASELKLS